MARANFKNKFTTKEENIAIRLSGKVKNFTGNTPGVIKVKIDDSLVTVQFKWLLSTVEKSLLANFKDQAQVNQMRKELIDVAKGKLVQAMSEVYNSEIAILDVNEELFQEKLNIQVRVLDPAC